MGEADKNARNRDTKQLIKVTIDPEWLLFDIMNETFLRGRTLRDEANHKKIASLFASEDEENREKILRSIKRSFAELQAELGEYLDEGTTETDNTHYDGTQSLSLNLRLPSNFNKTSTVSIGEAAHDYIKNYTLADWYLVTNKDDASDYYELAKAAIIKLLRAVSQRCRPTPPVRT